MTEKDLHPIGYTSEKDMKFTRKYMKLAKALADDNQSCFSRKIGVVLISEDNSPISFGYNGSISGAPHNDDPAYLAHLWQNVLSGEHKIKLTEKYKLDVTAGLKSFTSAKTGFSCITEGAGSSFAAQFGNCETCPRKLLDLPSGQYLEYCNCSHAERNAICNAAKRGASTKNGHMYCYCGTPCHECSIAIVQSKITKVTCLKSDVPDYSPSSRGILQMGGVELIHIAKEDI